jgi:uncharacterized Rossmann fold enzyme
MVLNLKEKINFYLEFKDWYFKIIKDFKFDNQKDREASNFLSRILMKKKDNWNLEDLLKSIKNLVQSKSFILIYGCGPSLEDTVEKIKGVLLYNKCVNLAADGAAVLLKEKQISIDVIFTDLDGITIDEFNYPEFIVVHAHGDNIEKLKFYEKKIINFKKIIGTTQVEPLKNLINPGGFTDGDRILYFIKSFLLPHQKLFLIGMDFNNIIGKYSKPEMTENQKTNPIKLKKLHYAIKLIEWLKKEIENEIYFVNSEAVSKKFMYISIPEFEKMILD